MSEYSFYSLPSIIRSPEVDQSLERDQKKYVSDYDLLGVLKISIKLSIRVGEMSKETTA